MTRTDLRFRAGDGTCAAWLYRPPGMAIGDTRPVIVLAHGVGGVKEMRLGAFAENFCDAGYLCLLFDYRNFGASSGEPRQVLDIDRQLEDWRAAVAYARTLDGVDHTRVVLWGAEFGGGHAIITAAKDPQIAAVVAQCPFVDGIASSLAVPTMTALRLADLATSDRMGGLRGRDPILVPAYGPPGSTALMSAPGCESGAKAMLAAGVVVPNAVAARFTLDIVRHFPGRYVRKLACPILFVVCEKDAVAPAHATRKYAAQAARGEVVSYRLSQFDIYVGARFEANLADQLAFLARHLPVIAELPRELGSRR
ncbi:alpha/beta hydrolase [Nocardia sp. NPDC056952]|uniref:alpha/beta hydrolase n=1 Tax=Nocardia sp. NPDC056952 TaxID=3345979 RepID=UPI00362E7A49